MASRSSNFCCLRTKQPLFSFNTSRSFTTSAIQQDRGTDLSKKRRRDPYALAQSAAKRKANLSRQDVLRQERAIAAGDPVRGVETEFLKSFDNPPAVTGNGDERLSFSLKRSILDANVAKSAWLTAPSDETMRAELGPAHVVGNEVADEIVAEKKAALEKERANAEEAMLRITSLSLGSSGGKMRANVQRCIDTFGRHNTDGTLAPRLRKEVLTKAQMAKRMPRIGQDTGSSEVQIAILTAKIRNLADILGKRGYMDKHNKRNLRVLVHRRQKLLKYLRRKERGGPRWQYLTETLGLTEGTWKGEITLPR